MSNLDTYEKALDDLVSRGDSLLIALQRHCNPSHVETAFKKAFGKQANDRLKELPSFHTEYQSWYSEARAVIKQVLPDRLVDFASHYEKPKLRKDITYATYRIEDCLQGVTVSRSFTNETVVGPDAAIPHFRQQLAILKSAKHRLKSSLFDMQQMVQADLFDSELDAATELAKQKFTRAAGALAGVVLERHLAQVCINHRVKISKKNPTISVFNEALKDAGVIDVPLWRFIQHLGDIRNLCDHSRTPEPNATQVDDLIAGVAKITKTLF